MSFIDVRPLKIPDNSPLGTHDPDDSSSKKKNFSVHYPDPSSTQLQSTETFQKQKNTSFGTNQDLVTQSFDQQKLINNEASFTKNDVQEIYGRDCSSYMGIPSKTLLTTINNDLMETRHTILELMLTEIQSKPAVMQTMEKLITVQITGDKSKETYLVNKFGKAKKLRQTYEQFKAQLQVTPHDKDLLMKIGDTSIALKKAQSQIMKYVRGIPKENLQEKTNQLIKREKKLILQQKACISDIEGSKKVTFLGIRRKNSDGYRYWAMPPAIDSNAFKEQGSFKTLTHRFTEEQAKQREDLGYKNTVALTLLNNKHSALSMLDPKICKVFERCTHTIEQIQVGSMFFAKAMSSDITDRKDLCLNNFQGALEDLKKYHDGGIAHRDLKPGNLLIDDKSGQIFISDLDTVVVIGEEFPSFSGTFSYLPLEMLRSTDQDKFKYQEGHVKVCDDHAMLKTLMEKVSPLLSTDQNKAKALTRNRSEKDVSKYWTKDDVVFESWIQRFVKPEYHKHIKKLFDSPKEYQAEYGDKLHLIDMLNFEADTV